MSSSRKTLVIALGLVCLCLAVYKAQLYRLGPVQVAAMTMSQRSKRTILMVLVAIPVLAGGSLATGAATALLDRMDRVYSRWTLEERVSEFWEARVRGDTQAATALVVQDSENPRKPLGGMVVYWGYTIKDITLKGADEAYVDLKIEYTIAMPGLDMGPGARNKQSMREKWVRSKGSWYWDQGIEKTDGVRIIEES